MTVDVQRALPSLPAAVEVAAYRIVQEALTNVVRHAGAHTCAVRVAVVGEHLSVEVSDDGVGLPDVGLASGVGLVSMRERPRRWAASAVWRPFRLAVRGSLGCR